MVLPARGGETIRPRCPFPRGVSRSITRELTLSRVVSSFSRSCGYSGVKLSKRILLRASSGDSKLTASILTRAKYFSPSCGGRTWPLIVSPVFKSNLRKRRNHLRGRGGGSLSSPPLCLGIMFRFGQNCLPLRACNPIQNLVHRFLDSGIGLVKLTGSLGSKLAKHITVPQSM